MPKQEESARGQASDLFGGGSLHRYCGFLRTEHRMLCGEPERACTGLGFNPHRACAAYQSEWILTYDLTRAIDRQLHSSAGKLLRVAVDVSHSENDASSIGCCV
jgi:hypothetical protein